MDDILRYRTCIFPDEAPPLIYVDIGNETHKGKFSHSSRTKNLPDKITKAIISNYDRDRVNWISEYVSNVLSGNIALVGCEKRKLSKHNLAQRKVVDKRVSLPGKKRLIVQRGWFFLPLLAAVLPTIASLIASKKQ